MCERIWWKGRWIFFEGCEFEDFGVVRVILFIKIISIIVICMGLWLWCFSYFKMLIGVLYLGGEV